MRVPDVVKQNNKELLERAKKLYASRALSEVELAEALGVKSKIAHQLTKQLKEQGANFVAQGDRLLLYHQIEPGGRVVLRPHDRGDGWTVFGFVTDKHLCNRHARLDVLQKAYEIFSAEGVTDVFDAGNWIDGEARFNKQELLVFGMGDQVRYFINEHPQVKGITTHFISGEDHEGWYAQRERINIGQYLEMCAEKAGRYDLRFMGHVEADVELKAKSGSAVMRVMHPGGGSAYAFSYAPQKIVESFQGGEKPAILLLGHYHKRDVCYPREVHVISGGCTEDQTMFMRKNKIAAHVGFTLVKIQQDADGHVTRLAEEWFPFYDRGFYEKRFTL